MKRLFTSAVLFVFTLVVILSVLDAVRSRSFTMKAKNINVGDTKDQVVAKIGVATTVFMPLQQAAPNLNLGVQVETWAYGSRLDWENCFHSEFPYFWPVRLRLFGPSSDDVEIEFDSEGRVSWVRVPTR